MITIASVHNGYILRHRVGEDETARVFEVEDTDKGEAMAAAGLLYAVLEQVGAYGSKHDAYRVRVSVIEAASGEDVMA